MKGIGEAGTIASPPAVINAIVDALSRLGVTDVAMPATPERVWHAIQEAKAMIPAPFDYEVAESVDHAVAAARLAARTRSSWRAGTGCSR